LGRTTPELADDALEWLANHHWPGNIRELRNVIDRCLVLCAGDRITCEHLPARKVLPEESAGATEPSRRDQAAGLPAPDRTATPETLAARLRFQKEETERQAILDALARCAGSQTRAAELLGMSRRKFCYLLKQYDIPRPRV
jgi:DNA-binding NtrC family response regulator